MFRTKLAAGMVACVLSFAGAVNAQSPDDEREARELEQARTQLNTARRDLEQAARTIAVQAVEVPDSENNGLYYRSLFVLGGSGRIGASIVDADAGALVTALAPGRGADEAGIRVGDVILSIDGVEVAGGDQDPSAVVTDRLRDVEPGATVAVVVERGGQSLEFEVETADGPAWGDPLSIPGSGEFRVFTPPDVPTSLYRLNENLSVVRTLGFAASPWADMELAVLSESLGRYFDTSEGLLVIRAPEDDAIDIEDGDVILSISGRTPNSPEHAIRILSSFEAGETMELSIMRDSRRRTVEYTMPERNVRRAPVPFSD